MENITNHASSLTARGGGGEKSRHHQQILEAHALGTEERGVGRGEKGGWLRARHDRHMCIAHFIVMIVYTSAALWRT